MIAKVFNRGFDYCELSPVHFVRDIRKGEVEVGAVVKCDSFTYERDDFFPEWIKELSEEEAFNVAEEVFCLTNNGHWSSRPDEVIEKPRRSTSPGDLIAFYDDFGPVFVARCENRGWVRQNGTAFFKGI